jgi:RNA polymerase sigma-70 factor (ECF subfamily)
MEDRKLLPELSGLFRKEYHKIVSVLCYRFGIQHIEIAQDIVSDTFLAATETWSHKGVPDNPAAWLYTVAKNKTKNHLKRQSVFEQKLVPQIEYLQSEYAPESEIDLSEKNIKDSQLAMIFAVCNPCNSRASQVALALHLLCGFEIEEIADAYLTNKEVIYKRINRAKQKLREENIKIEQPDSKEIAPRLDNVLTTIYLLFSEGYHSNSDKTLLRKDLCAEAMRLCHLLTENQLTDQPQVSALMSLMCFHASRFEARVTSEGEYVLYQDQDTLLWNPELIEQGTYFLARAARGTQISKYHMEAGIAYWHTKKDDTTEKWSAILGYYDDLLLLDYSPVVALNRAFALGKVEGKEVAIAEAEKIALLDNRFYHALLGELYTGLNDERALGHFQQALALARSAADKSFLRKKLEQLLLS